MSVLYYKIILSFSKIIIMVTRRNSVFGHFWHSAVSAKLLILGICPSFIQKQPLKGVLSKRCSKNMQQIYKRTPMPKCDFNKVAKQITLRYECSPVNLLHIFRTAFTKNTSGWLLMFVVIENQWFFMTTLYKAATNNCLHLQLP